MTSNTKKSQQEKRHRRIRAKISGSSERPRLVVFRSLQHIYAQLIDDSTGKTICGTSDINTKSKSSKIENAKIVGKEIAQKALENKITTCVFDKNGYKYHGRVKAVADAAREGGLKF